MIDPEGRPPSPTEVLSVSWVSNGFVATGEAVWLRSLLSGRRAPGHGWLDVDGAAGAEGAVVPEPSLDVCVVVVLVSRRLLSSGPRHCLATGLVHAGLPVEGGCLYWPLLSRLSSL